MNGFALVVLFFAAALTLNVVYAFKLTNRHLNPRSQHMIASVKNDDREFTQERTQPHFKEVTSATALIAGTTVGAGILALPSVAFLPGFVPSAWALLGTWLYMSVTGLLIAELSSNLAKVEDNKAPGILSMISVILGKPAATVGGIVYTFIHYALLVAYIAQAGKIINDTGHLPENTGQLVFTTALGFLLARGSKELIETTNNFLVLVVFATFVALVAIGLPFVRADNLANQDYSEIIHAIPVMLVALVYHNVVPTVCTSLHYHRPSITAAITIGSFLPLTMFILWNYVVLGIGLSENSVIDANKDAVFDAVAVLQSSSANEFIGPVSALFSEVAIITSFIGFVVGLMDFYLDVFPSRDKRDLGLYSLVLLPPMVLAILYPSIFNSALDFAGTFGISVLFGLLPAAMAAKLRLENKSFNSLDSDDVEKLAGARGYQEFVPGGFAVLGGVALGAGVVITQKLFEG